MLPYLPYTSKIEEPMKKKPKCKEGKDVWHYNDWFTGESFQIIHGL